MSRVAAVALVTVAVAAVSVFPARPATAATNAPASPRRDWHRPATTPDPRPPSAVTYQPPVIANVVDQFRPPASAYGAGNRGVDYATATGTPVQAAAPGQVVFAGRVGLGLHVVVLHADGVRTSYSFLASVAARRGQRIGAGQPLGEAGPRLHFGARAGEAYLDPLVLLGGAGRQVVRLVPDRDRLMGTEAEERGALRRFLGAVSGTVADVGGAAVSWARGAAGAAASTIPTPEELQALLREAGLAAGPRWLRAALTVRERWAAQEGCTPAGTSPPPPTARRRAVLVAGLGSTSESASVDDVDTAGLGYAPTDVVRFSYRGGTTADNAYDAADTQVDIAESGRRLRELLERLHAADPGVPIDVITHSQGGLVARVGLGARAPPGVVNLITLATPHHGADLATMLARTASTPEGALLQTAVAAAGVSGIDPTSTSVRQLAETSDLIRSLAAQPLPAGVRVTSIAARADMVVPSPRSRLDGASNVVVTVPGLNEHSALPGSPGAQREMALALAGMGPTCQSLAAMAADVMAGEAISAAEDMAGLALVALAR